MTIQLPKDLEDLLRGRTANDAEIEAFLREAVAEKLAQSVTTVASDTPAPAYELGKHLFEKHDLGSDDLAEKSEDLLRGVLDAECRR